MIFRNIAVDGMLSGTGIRDKDKGGYIPLENMHLPDEVVDKIRSWLSRYELAHYKGFTDLQEVECLDRDGIAITENLKSLLLDSKVEYFSAALMKNVDR
jgi:hypothetical protein